MQPRASLRTERSDANEESQEENQNGFAFAFRRREDPLTLDADACVTFCELSVPVVARLCEVLGLPGAERTRSGNRRVERWVVGGCWDGLCVLQRVSGFGWWMDFPG